MLNYDKICFLDIETGPLPEADLSQVMPAFAAPANFKDPEKIAAHLARQRADWLEGAALSALTGQILAVGLLWTDRAERILEGPEHIILPAVFEEISACHMGASYHLAGFNLHAFDLPFLCRRAWVNGLRPPPLLVGHYFPAWIIDLRMVWGFWDRQAKGTLAEICGALGIPPSRGDGADFARLYADPATRGEALAHLSDDLDRTKRIAEKIL